MFALRDVALSSASGQRGVSLSFTVILEGDSCAFTVMAGRRPAWGLRRLSFLRLLGLTTYKEDILPHIFPLLHLDLKTVKQRDKRSCRWEVSGIAVVGAEVAEE